MRLVILGKGGYGRTIADIAEQSDKYDEILFLDDHDQNAVGLCAEYKKYISDNTEFYPAFGNNHLRSDWVTALKTAGAKVCSMIHPTAYVSPTSLLGDGVVILPNASVGSNVRICDACIINMNAVVDHDCFLAEGVHIGLGAVLKSCLIVEEYTKVEAGSVILNQRNPAGGQ